MIFHQSSNSRLVVITHGRLVSFHILQCTFHVIEPAFKRHVLQDLRMKMNMCIC